EIEQLRKAGLIGPDAGGSGRRLSVEGFTSPGGYIRGEESALIESVGGHRGEPRNKPPFPGTYGLYGKPTLMNSVETFAHVPVIAVRGAPWWRAQGRGDHAGLKFFAVSGHVERPGVYCVAMGTSARELLDLAGGVAGGQRLGAIQPGGASSNFIGPDQLDVELDFGRCRRRVPCWGPARSSSWPKAPTCSPRQSSSCGSSATNRAASACRAGS